MVRGFGIVIFPTSWLWGVVRNKENKFVYSVGPIRFCYHKVLK